MKILGLLLSLVFLYIFIKQDQKEWPRYSLILWLPLTWLLITSTRLLQILFPSPAALDAYDAIGAYFEGNPRNRIILLSMIILGLILFVKKRISFNEVFKQNAWLFLLYFFAFISIGWSNYPYVSFKRWITIFGSLVMALLIIFQDDHEEAIEHFIRRYAAIFLVISTFLFKFHEQSGFVTTRLGTKVWAGLATHRNDLGMLCSFFIVFLIWRIFKLRPTIIFYDVVLLIISTWLLIRAGSATAYLITGIGLPFLIGMTITKDGFKFSKYMTLCLFTLTLLFLFMVLNTHDMNKSNIILSSTGRDSTLTGRVPMWEYLININRNNLLLGSGYESYWLSNMEIIWQRFSFGPINAHNGYLDVYLGIGIIGLTILMITILNSLICLGKKPSIASNHGKILYVLLIMILLRNVTESSFMNLSFLWFLYQIISLSTGKKHHSR